MHEVRDAIAAILDHRTLADLYETMQRLQREGEEQEALMYYI